MLFQTTYFDGATVGTNYNDDLFSVDSSTGGDLQRITKDDNSNYEASWGRGNGTGGLPNPQPDLMIGFSTSALVGKGIYNTDGAEQTKSANLKRGAKKTFFIVLENAGDLPDTIALKGPAGSPGFSITYLLNGKDVTSAMEAGTLLCKSAVCKPGKGMTIQLIVAVKNGAHAGAVESALVTARSHNNSTKTDAVEAKIKVIA
jgi:hypothetical protein